MQWVYSEVAMSESNLEALRKALLRKGWKVHSELPGNDYDVSASWEIGRGGEDRTLIIDFQGLDDMKTLPLNQSYACNVRGKSGNGLYFRRPGHKGSNRRQLWTDDLDEFVRGLEAL